MTEPRTTKKFMDRHPQVRSARRVYYWLLTAAITLGLGIITDWEHRIARQVLNPPAYVFVLMTLYFIASQIAGFLTASFPLTQKFLNRAGRRRPRLKRAGPLRFYGAAEEIARRRGTLLKFKRHFVAANLAAAGPVCAAAVWLGYFNLDLIRYSEVMEKAPLAILALLGLSLAGLALIAGLGHIAAARLTLALTRRPGSGRPPA